MQVAPKASTGHGGSGDGEGRHKQKQQAFHRTRVGHDCDGIKVTRVSSEHGKADGVDAIKFWDQAIERLKQGEKWIILIHSITTKLWPVTTASSIPKRMPIQ